MKQLRENRKGGKKRGEKGEDQGQSIICGGGEIASMINVSREGGRGQWGDPG